MHVALTLTGDPIHMGHVHLLREATKIASRVTVYLPVNPDKSPTISHADRMAIAMQVVLNEGLDPQLVQVKTLRSGFTAEVARRDGVSYLIRGLRSAADFQYEADLNHANTVDLNGIPTLYLMSPPEYQHLSSSYIRKLIAGRPVGWHWLIQDKVPQVVYARFVMDFLRKEWEAVTCDIFTDNESVFNQLVVAYSGSDRKYHNLDHIVHGLSEINEWAFEDGAHPMQVRALKLAFWFHDVFMSFGTVKDDTRDEELSAQYWTNSPTGVYAYDSLRDSVAELIRATDHFQTANITNPLKDVMVSVDLAILGQKRSVYEAYIKGIRYEYGMYSEAEFCAGRTKVLSALLEKDKLFNDEYFNNKYESDARWNLSRELEHLTNKG